MSHAEPHRVPGILRKLLFAVLLFGFVGAGIELLLLGHTEGIWQKIPLALLAAGVAAAIFILAVPRRATVRLFQAVMLLCVAGGFTGLWLHIQGNREFELEMVPSLSGFALFRESMTGATPALAPGAMIQLGLLGLACAFRHPALEKPLQPQQESQQKS